MSAELLCPFCGESGYDAPGLKAHLESYCDRYRGVPDVARLPVTEDRPAEGGGMGKDTVLAVIDLHMRRAQANGRSADIQTFPVLRATVESLFAEVERLKAERAHWFAQWNKASDKLAALCRQDVGEPEHKELHGPEAE